METNSENFMGIHYLLNIIKNKIVSIIFITLITIFLTTFTVKKLNDNTIFKSITTLDGSRSISFDTITNLENNFNSFLLKDTALPDTKLKIQNIDYFDLYIQSFNKEFFIKIFDENNFLIKKDYKSDESYLNALTDLYENNLAMNVEKRIVFQNQVTNSVWSLKFTASQSKKEQWKEILKKIENESKKNLKDQIIKSIYAKLELVNTIIDNNITSIDNKISFYLNEHFEFKNKELLIYLKDQAILARELGLDNGLNYLKGSNINDVINLYDERGSEFLSFQWGYIALEKKIQEVSERSKKDAKYYVKEYENLLKKRNELVQKKIFYNNLYDNTLKNLSFFNNEFSDKVFNVSTKISLNKINPVINIILNILFVITINVIFIAIIALKNKK